MENKREKILDAIEQAIREHNGQIMRCQYRRDDGFEHFSLNTVHESVWLIAAVTAGAAIGVFVDRIVIPKVEDCIHNHKKNHN